MPEIHLFILWEKVGVSQGAVLDRICSEFEVLRVFRVQWSRSLFSHNLSRFYGEKLPPECNKEAGCGVGPFILVIVRDVRPNYVVRETTRGKARVNARTFDLKAFYRSPSGGSLPIHATDTLSETSHDLALLLGLDLDQFVKAYSGVWDGEVIPLKKDVVGARGWVSIEELFTILNATLDYVVLRNFECLPKQYHMDEHGDIDLLVGSYSEACLILNSAPVFNEPDRVHHTVIIGGLSVPFDFRYVGDGYYDECWQRHILESRVLADGGFYIPDADNHFYSLLYHAVVHKRCLGSDYVARLTDLSSSLGAQRELNRVFNHPNQARKFLLRHLKRHGYKFTRPLDATVYFNASVALNPIGRILSEILPLQPKSSPVISLNKTVETGASPYAIHHILPGLRQCQDVSSHSLEVQSLIYNSDSEHLLSPTRANLLRPFFFGPGMRVLELGCEGGSITRFLGELGAEVVAIENSPPLAAIAMERCRELSNVLVLCDDPISAELSGKFDVVILVGLPGRASMSSDLHDPLSDCLERARSLLRVNGLLMVALDNQLGLRFFNGCKGSDANTPYFGINGLHDKGERTSFGRHELRGYLQAAGFSSLEFLYPFPDYKFPGLILSEAGLVDPGMNVPDMLIDNAGRDYPESRHRAFDEALAWQAVAYNHLLPDMANSFLVLARPGGGDHAMTTWLAKNFSSGRRRPCFQVETTIEGGEKSELLVRKKKIFAGAQAFGSWLRHKLSDSRYIAGQLLIRKIREAMAREAGIEELAFYFSPWLEFLKANANVNVEGRKVLPGSFIDCIPGNMIEDAFGKLHYFDAEWVSIEPIPMGWVITRGITYSLIGCLENRSTQHLTYRKVITLIARRSGIELADEDFEMADELEARMIAECHADASSKPRLMSFLDEELFLMYRLAGNVPELKRELAWHQKELGRVKNTFSWRITSPLRVVWNIYLKLGSKRQGVNVSAK